MKSFDCCIRNAQAFNGDGTLSTTAFGIEDGRIAAIDVPDHSTADREIDARSLLAFSGLVDPHVHFNEPGRESWEGFQTGSMAAAAGGITTVFDMPLNSSPPVCDCAAFEAKATVGDNSSFIDFGIWGGLVPGNLEHLEPLAVAGVVGFKAFMCDSGLDEYPASDPETLSQGMQRIASLGLRLAVHAEHPDQLGRGGTDAGSFLASRPVAAELAAIDLALEIAQATSCPLHVVHVSCPESIDRILDARAAGVDVTCETCPHYLLLREADVANIGTPAKCAPPLRSETCIKGMHERLADGRIDFVASDHSPCPTSMKPSNDFASAWGGISGIQHGFRLLNAREIVPLHMLADLMSSHPAKIFGLTQKGRLQVGADADFVLFDPEPDDEVRAEDLLYRHTHTPYIGLSLSGAVRATYLRGQLIYEDGVFPADPGGRLVTPRR